MTAQHPSRDDASTRDQACIADDTTTTMLNDLTQPLGRSALSVAAIVVADALTAVAGIADPIGSNREVNTRMRLARTDEEASLLARLLDTSLENGRPQRSSVAASEPLVFEMGDNQSSDLPWSITLAATSITLGYHRDQAEKRPAIVLRTVADRARRFLQYLTEPGQSSRWTKPLPRDTSNLEGNLPGAVQQRWQARQAREAAAARAVLTRWLHLDELPQAGVQPEHWWAQLGLAPEVRPLLATWCRWLRGQGILAADEDVLRLDGQAVILPRPGMGQDAWEQPVTDMVALLATHEEVIHRVLTGKAPATKLLTIGDLRPGRLAAGEPELMPVWQQVGDLLADQARHATGPVSLADLGGATLDNAHLSTVVDRADVVCTVLAAGRPHAGEDLFDVVLAVGCLHRWPDPEDAVRTVSSLLRPGGTLIAVENTELSPLGLLIAGLFENGFTDATGIPIDAPTQDEDTWLRLLNSAGFRAVSTPVGPTPAVLIHAQKTSDPAPQRIPLDGPDGVAGPIRAGTETEVARLWSQLLQATPRSRADSFFELGGDSLRATRFIAAVRQRFGITIAMREIFARPQLAAVAQRIDVAIAAVSDDTHEEGVL